MCRETIKAESLWDGHIRSATHRQQLQASQTRNLTPTTGGAAPSHKRKHDDDEESVDEEEADAVRRKRSKNDIAVPAPLVINGDEIKEQNLVPPTPARRASATPVQGVEMQIASRPATPSTTPNLNAPFGPSPFIPQEAAATPLPPRQANTAQVDKVDAVDEDEWTAFEADIAAAEAPYSADAVISAPAMTAAEVEARAEEEKKRPAVEAELEDEKEEATRALENEFEEMEELEERVRKLKEKRAALRVRTVGETAATEGMAEAAKGGTGKENVGMDEDADLDDDDDEEDDDWVGFRFRG